MKNYAYGLWRTCDKHIDPILTDVSTGRHRLLSFTFCFAYFHPVDQGNWYRRHCTENYRASPKAILTLHKMFLRDWCETILTYFGYPMKRRNCAKQQEDALDLEACSSHMYIWKSNFNDNGSRNITTSWFSRLSKYCTAVSHLFALQQIITSFCKFIH